MKKLLTRSLIRTKILPGAIICIAFVSAAVLTYAFSTKPHNQTISTKNTPHEKGITHISSASSSATEHVLGTSTHHVLPTLATNKQTAQPTTSANTAAASHVSNSNSDTSSNQQTAPTTAPLPTTPATPTQTPASATVQMQVQTPGGTSSFSTNLNTGANACDVLQEAKNEGKITSVTFDDSYMSSLHSRYVTEISGYQNNWTFTVNGSSPLGCSLANPKPNDSIVWKFG